MGGGGVGEDQEVAQQVHDRSCQPLSSVSMEPSKRGVATFHDSSCVATFVASRSRAGKRIEIESK